MKLRMRNILLSVALASMLVFITPSAIGAISPNEAPTVNTGPDASIKAGDTFSSDPLPNSPAPVLNPANGHYYEEILVPGGLNWFAAKAAAESRYFMGVQGHLATITSAQEDNFIGTISGYQRWLGGFQPPGSPEPAGNWQWVTCEPFSYTNWRSGEPNNSHGEDVIEKLPGGWNDLSSSWTRGGYVVEYGGPTPDRDGDGTPDCMDGCPDDANKTEPGVCGCGVADDDSDGDGVADCNDNCPCIINPGQQDSDGDGIGDACEYEIWTVQYRWGAPAPGYSFADWPIFEGWLEVRIENRGSGDAFNVTATISGWPANVTVPDPDVAVGDIPAGESAWSTAPDPSFTTRVNMAQPADPCEGVFWHIEYDDACGVHHVVENVPEFPPGEGPCG